MAAQAKARLANPSLRCLLDQDQTTSRWQSPDMQNIGEFLSLFGRHFIRERQFFPAFPVFS